MHGISCLLQLWPPHQAKILAIGHMAKETRLAIISINVELGDLEANEEWRIEVLHMCPERGEKIQCVAWMLVRVHVVEASTVCAHRVQPQQRQRGHFWRPG